MCRARGHSDSGFHIHNGQFQSGVFADVVYYSGCVSKYPMAISLPYVSAGEVSGAMNIERSLYQHRAIAPICASSKRRSIRAISPRTIRWSSMSITMLTPTLTFSSQTGYNNDTCGPRRITTGSIRQRIFSCHNWLVASRTAIAPARMEPIRLADLARPFLTRASMEAIVPQTGYYFTDPQLGKQQTGSSCRMFHANMPGN